MFVFPLVAAGVSVLFAAALFLQYAHRKRLPQLAWGIALSMFAIASLAVTGGVAGGWDPTLYRVFWLFGALLNVPWLATGSIALVSRKPVGVVALALTILGSIYALVAVIGADVNRAALDTSSIPTGRDAWGRGSAQTHLLTYYSIVPFFIVVAIAIWSSLPRKGMRPPADRARGNLLIALGVTVVAVGGFALRRIAQGSAFSVSLAVGITVMYVGFRLASRAPRYTLQDPGDSPT